MNKTSIGRNLTHDLKKIGSVLRASFAELKANDPLRMAAATAFFATFAFPPILIILIRIFGLFIDRRMFARALFNRLNELLDRSSVEQTRQVLLNIRDLRQSWFVTILSFIFFLFVASTLFNVIKNTIEQIWRLRRHESPGFKAIMLYRGRSIAVIVLAGLLFAIGIFVGSVNFLPDNTAGDTINSLLNVLGSLVVTATWFTVLFRMISIGRPHWKMALAGGVMTAILFDIGKRLVKSGLAYSNIGSIYGPAGSIVLVMLFVFYSSFIVYFGACFIKVLSESNKLPILPVRGAFRYRYSDVEEDTD